MKIIGTGSALPCKEVTNDMLAQFMETSDEWITSRTGIRARRIITTETLEGLASEAAQKALEASGLKPEEIDYILCSNVAANVVTPGISTIVEGALGCHCPCVDMNVACVGFVYALDFAEAFLQTGRAKNILIVSAEEPAHFCNWDERDTSILFGDGAGAVVVTAGDNYLASLFTCTSNRDVIHYNRRMQNTPFDVEGVEYTEPLVMQGREVFRNAVSASQRDLDKVIAKAGLTPADIKYFLLHQANLRIIASIQEHMGQPSEKFPTNLENYGNTSSASIPILLDEMVRSGRLKEGDIVAFSAFGAGFATGASVVRM